MPINELLATIEAFDHVVIDNTPFHQLTTLHIGGTPRATIRCSSTTAVCDVVQLLDANDIPLLIVGGGSNLVVADGDVPVVAVVLECTDCRIDAKSGAVEAEAGASWDDIVAASVAAGLGGIECLSGIPGSAGATPVQNVGAYGAEISDVLTEVELFDRTTRQRSWVPASSLDLAYRYSNLKFTSRAVVLSIRLALRTDGLSAPLRFGELARKLAVAQEESDARRPVADVRAAVLQLRRAKGMVYDESDHDTWSAGSFFTNPIVPEDIAEQVREVVEKRYGAETAAAMPCFNAGSGKKKLSAAWLIDRAGYHKGYPGHGPARLSTKHTLALTNRGTATTEDLVNLARDIRSGVYAAFSVTLEPEPVWVGVSIDGD
ncbi:UDP-N-acetylmuramate dehydrogenase [Corynebacterium mustelae]|uniref:UDP-N-acetylenolpyruvoylglucosamine reductase n=1 Tax=Corynebacterium mustelae TaxID=571915 RepID=A0A0G3GU39_9CORY|nr:UDP-N-acetylmuramate dehydrogenase [Corynebacterium mustelae]AKK04651.1 UDP-N-acetylmuramate dehydrogenase [Corynebacterium mustelae]